MSSRPGRVDPWERQEDETAVAFEAFAVYRDMGVFRSTSKVAKELGKNQKNIQKWSSAHSWVLRVNAWDAELDRIERREIVEARRQMRKRHVDLAVDFQEKLANQMSNLAPEVWEKILIDPTAMARWLKVSTEVERAALGDPDRADLGAKHGRAEDEVDLTDLTDEEIRQRMQDLRRELDSALGEYDDEETDAPDREDVDA